MTSDDTLIKSSSLLSTCYNCSTTTLSAWTKFHWSNFSFWYWAWEDMHAALPHRHVGRGLAQGGQKPKNFPLTKSKLPPDRGKCGILVKKWPIKLTSKKKVISRFLAKIFRPADLKIAQICPYKWQIYVRLWQCIIYIKCYHHLTNFMEPSTGKEMARPGKKWLDRERNGSTGKANPIRGGSLPPLPP